MPASAQDKEFAQPPEKLPKLQRGQDLDFLFGALKVAPDADAAKAVEGRIWALWMVSKSDTANLLMTRVRTAVEAKNLDLAVKLLDSIVVLRPDYVEGLEPARDHQFHAQGLHPLDRGYPPGAGARAAPFRCAVGSRA